MYLSNNFFFLLRFTFAALDFSFIAGSFLFSFFNLQDEEFGKRVLRIRGISTGAKKFVWRRRPHTTQWVFVLFGKNVKDGELFAIFFDGNEKETTLDEKNTLIMRRLALKLDLLLRIHSLLGRQRKNSGCLFFFFVLRWT